MRNIRILLMQENSLNVLSNVLEICKVSIFFFRVLKNKTKLSLQLLQTIQELAGLTKNKNSNII